MILLVIGTSYKFSSIEIRECLAPLSENLDKSLLDVLGLPKVNESFILSTCNRVEVFVVVEDAMAVNKVYDWFVRDVRVAFDFGKECFYSYQGEDAVKHLFQVASSLDSMVVGEPQILGQMKEAYRVATGVGTSGTILNKLLHKTFQVAKRVRTETNIGTAAISISYAAVELARKIFDNNLQNLSVLLIGAGEMAELAAEHLVTFGVKKLFVANRTVERGVELIQRLAKVGGVERVFKLNEIPLFLQEMDIIIASATLREPVIKYKFVKKILKNRRGRLLFFIDIGMPRNIEAEVSEIDGCFLYNIDDLAQVVEINKKNRLNEAKLALRIINEEVYKFKNWLNSLDVLPTIVDLVKKVEDIRRQELSKTLTNLNELNSKQRLVLDRLTKSIVKKILHDPIIFLKDKQFHNLEKVRRKYFAFVRKMFKLGD